MSALLLDNASATLSQRTEPPTNATNPANPVQAKMTKIGAVVLTPLEP